MDKPLYINWIVKEDGVVFEDQHPLNCYRLSHEIDDNVLDDWAVHIRRNYIPDVELENDAAILNLSVEEYLRQYIIPQKGEPLGPTARSNDISEILFADLFQFILNYEVPRCKQYNRSGKTVSEHGTDIIAYKFINNTKTPNKNDELVAVEVKAELTSKEACKVIRNAVKDSKKDEVRLSFTLNYYRKKLIMMGKREEAESIARFQQKPEIPYRLSYVGAAISSVSTIENSIIIGISGEDLKLKTEQSVFYVHGKDLMTLTHRIFERCTK